MTWHYQVSASKNLLAGEMKATGYLDDTFRIDDTIYVSDTGISLYLLKFIVPQDNANKSY